MSEGEQDSGHGVPSPAGDKADELFAVGDHCAVCGALDFLPHPCSGCHGVFCTVHRLAPAHKCIAGDGAPAAAAVDASASARVIQRCGVVGCGAEAKVQMCDGCGRVHCPRHRHASDHGCAAAESVDADAAAARKRAELAHANAKAKADEARAAAEAKRAARRKRMNPSKVSVFELSLCA